MSVLRIKSLADLSPAMADRNRSAGVIKPSAPRHTPQPLDAGSAPGISGEATGGQAQVVGGSVVEIMDGAKIISDIEETLAGYMRAVGIPTPMREYKFDPKRRWRADFAWPERMLLVEVEGGHWTGGRHTRGAGFDKDCEKYNEAALFGWKLIRVTSTHIKTGEALAWIVRALI